MNDDSTLSIDDLLRESAWISGLARSLVRDAQSADDLVQETWLSALRRPPAHARSPRGWLATVLRNTLRQQRRKEGTRQRHEIASGAKADGPSAAALAERVELSRRVASLALELDEPFRSTVLRRHFEGESSAAIARREGVPEGTVRWRLKEGLDRLRSRLDREFDGDRRAWCAALLPLARRGAVAPAGGLALTAGGLLVKATSVAAAVLVVGAAVWVAPSGGGRPEGEGPVREAKAAAPSIDPGEAKPERAASASERERAESAPDSRVAGEDAAPARTERTAAIRARVVDPAGRPLEGATIVLTDVPGHRASSAADGTVRMSGEVPEALVPWLFDEATFRVSLAGYTTEEVRAHLSLGEVVPLGDVVLRPGATVVGRVADASGRPAAGAKVWSVVLVDGTPMTAEALNSEARATTDAAGRFELAGVPAGVIRIEASGTEGKRAHSEALDVGAGDRVEGIEVTVPAAEERSPWIDGVVVDPTGAPVDQASVEYTASLGASRVGGSTRTDEDGAFRVVVNVGAEHRLIASTFSGEHRASEEVVARPGDRVTLRLRASRTFDVVAVGGDGFDLREFSGFTRTGDSRVNTFAETDDGTLALQLPDTSFTLVVEAPLHDRAEMGPLDPARVAVDGVVEVALRPLPALSGVVTLDGEPVEGAAVRVHAMATGRTEADGFPVRVSPVRAAQGTTAADGSFALTLRERGTYVVRVDCDGAAPAEKGPFEYEPAVGVAPLDVRLGEGGVLEGRVLPPPGRSAAGTIVGISRGDGYARTVRVGADGRFLFDRLIPGRYHVVRHDRELRSGPPRSFGTFGTSGIGELPWSCEVFDGRTTRHDLDLSTCVVRGRLLCGADESAALHVSLVDPASSAPALAPVAVGAGGGFTILAPAAGAYLLRVLDEDGATRLEEPIEVRWGETRWSGRP